jgi:hypothetical protein
MAQKLITSQDVEHIGPMVFDRVRVALESKRDPDDPDAEYYRYALSIEGHEIVKRVTKLDPVSNVAAQAAEVYGAFPGCAEMAISIQGGPYIYLVEDRLAPEVGMDERVRRTQIYGGTTAWSQDFYTPNLLPEQLTGGVPVDDDDRYSDIACSLETRRTPDTEEDEEQYRHVLTVRLHSYRELPTGFKPLRGENVTAILAPLGTLAGHDVMLPVTIKSTWGPALRWLVQMDEYTSGGQGVVRRDVALVNAAEDWEDMDWEPQT